MLITEEVINTLLAELNSRSINAPTRKSLLKKIMGILDLTSLEGTDNYHSINRLCAKAVSPADKGLPLPAAVCVYPPFVRQAREHLGSSGIRIASVAGAFPSGQLPIHLKTAEVEFAVDEGADEIDMVISRGTFLAGKFQTVQDEISAIKKACGSAHLKVILETGELPGPDAVFKASILAIEAGADFIKTSTGKIQPAATPSAMITMLLAIKDTFDKTGKRIGIKPAGGISTPDQALQYYSMVEFILGDEWLHPEYFRIGASRLADALVEELKS